MRRAMLTAVVGVTLVVLLAAPAMGGPGNSVIYRSLATNGPPSNLPSYGAEAYAYKEFGNKVTFEANGPRQLTNVVVTLSSWGCVEGHWYSGDCYTPDGSTFELPMTLTIYEVGSGGTTVGDVLATKTDTFSVPYRPSASSRCSGGRWWSAGLKLCFNGLAKDVTFDFEGQDVTLPDEVVFGITYNTSHYGYAPIGHATACYSSSGGCPYDSLNIALNVEAPSVGSSTDGAVWQNSPYGSMYCDGGTGGTNTFREDYTSGCWSPYVPAVQFKAGGGASG